MGAQIETPRGGFGIVNVLALVPVLEELPAVGLADYSSESASERIKRRAERWTPLERVV